MKVHGDEMVATSRYEHVRDEFCGDGGSALVFLILTRIWVTRNDGCDATGRGGSTCGYEDEKFHHVVVNVEATGLDDEDILVTNRLRNFDVDFAIGEALDISRDKRLV